MGGRFGHAALMKLGHQLGMLDEYAEEHVTDPRRPTPTIPSWGPVIIRRVSGRAHVQQRHGGPRSPSDISKDSGQKYTAVEKAASITSGLGIHPQQSPNAGAGGAGQMEHHLRQEQGIDRQRPERHHPRHEIETVRRLIAGTALLLILAHSPSASARPRGPIHGHTHRTMPRTPPASLLHSGPRDILTYAVGNPNFLWPNDGHGPGRRHGRGGIPAR